MNVIFDSGTLKGLWARSRRWAFASLLVCFGAALCSCLPQPPATELPHPVRAEQITAFVNVHLVPMTHEAVLANHTVVVKGTHIAASGPSGAVPLPPDGTIINGRGNYLMPGLADMHIHTAKDWPGTSKWQLGEGLGNWPVSPLHLFLANGVTTVRCLGPKGEPESYVLDWRDRIKRGELIGPRIYSCGPQLRGPVRTPAVLVRKQKTAGYDLIKLYSYLSLDEFIKALSTARQAGMYSVGHIPFQVGLEGALSAGLDEVAHIEELLWEMVVFDRNKDLRGEDWMDYVTKAAFRQLASFIDWSPTELEERFEFPIAHIARKLRTTDVPVCTTLHLDDVIVEKLHTPERFLAKPENRYLPEHYLAAFRAGREKHQVQFKGGEAFAPLKQRLDRIFLKHLRKVGVPLVLGTDAGTGGMGNRARFLHP